ncbi:MAG: hypothetical protein Q9192_007005 [Flavoplaca navasiana]
MTTTAPAIPSCKFPSHVDPRIWLLSSGASPIAIALSRQLLAHGDVVAFGVQASDTSDTSAGRAADFTLFWTQEVLVNEGWKDRAKLVRLDGRVRRVDSAQSLSYEVAPFNIKMTIVQPNLEINLLTNQITTAPQLPQYAPETNPAPLFREIIGGLLDRVDATTATQELSNEHSDQCRFSSDKIVSVYPELSEETKLQLLAETVNALAAIGGHDNPPARHIVGHEAVASVKEKLKTVSEELEDFLEVSYSVDLQQPRGGHRQGSDEDAKNL